MTGLIRVLPISQPGEIRAGDVLVSPQRVRWTVTVRNSDDALCATTVRGATRKWPWRHAADLPAGWQLERGENRPNADPLLLAWLAGVLHGDGWCTRRTLGLRSSDAPFAETFATALNSAFSLSTSAKRDERGYWVVRVGNKSGRFDHVRKYSPSADPERAAWIRGLFDSEGNANLSPMRKGGTAYSRRVSFYSTSLRTLRIAEAYLATLDFATVLTEMSNSRSHIGNKPVYQLRLRCSRDQFERFAEVIGSSIPRKQQVLDALGPSYHPPGHLTRISPLGIAARRARRDAGGRY